MLFCQYSERVNGKALFTQQSFKKGDLVFVLSGEVLEKPTKYSIEINRDQHIIDKFGVYMNHSSTPTTKIVGPMVIAARDIKENEELNFDYNATETKCVAPFVDLESGLLIAGFSPD